MKNKNTTLYSLMFPLTSRTRIDKKKINKFRCTWVLQEARPQFYPLLVRFSGKIQMGPRHKVVFQQKPCPKTKTFFQTLYFICFNNVFKNNMQNSPKRTLSQDFGKFFKIGPKKFPTSNGAKSVSDFQASKNL